MPMPKDAKVLGQKRSGKYLILSYKTPSCKIKSEVRESCKCPPDKSKPCHCGERTSNRKAKTK
jgi:hypothetical protein